MVAIRSLPSPAIQSETLTHVLALAGLSLLSTLSLQVNIFSVISCLGKTSRGFWKDRIPLFAGMSIQSAADM